MSWTIAVWIPVQLAEFLIAYTFFKDFLGNKKQSKWLWAVCVIAYVAVLNFIDIDNFAIKILLGLSLNFALSLMFNGNIKIKLLATCLYYIFLFIADAVVFLNMGWIFKVEQSALIDGGIFAVTGAITSKLLVLFIVKIVCRLRKKYNSRLSLQHWIAIITYPIISCFLIYMLSQMNWQTSISPLMSSIAVVCVLYFNIIAFYLFEYFSERSEREFKQRALERQIAAQKKETARQNAKLLSKKSFLHDIRHHNQLLLKLVEKGDIKEAIDLITSKISKLNDLDGEYVFTGNTAINALFNSELAYAETQNIKIDVTEIHLPTGAELETEDICIIFANSLENAIEACQKVDENNRFIKIILKYRDDRLVYKITNPTDGKAIKNKDGGFKSTKTTAGDHGLGIENIEKAVYKYGGVFKAEHSDNVFTLTFSIPIISP